MTQARKEAPGANSLPQSSRPKINDALVAEVITAPLCKDVKQYRKSTQSFRHATDDTLRERANIPENEKKLLSDLGVFIAVHLHNHLNVATKAE